MLGRRDLDNVVIAQELIYTLDRKKGKMGFMASKVDPAKAYDHLEWSFIRNIRIAFWFSEALVELIMSCVSSTSTSIIFNGGKFKSFMPTRGIRQRDPLSPYLFILCMEYLGSLINKKCMKKEWTPLKASKHNMGISHLFFTDDLMLFAKADKSGAKSIKEVLNKFCKESGQEVSAQKSSVYFSPNVPSNIKQDICNMLDILETLALGKYLGFPINHKGAARNRYNFITKRVISKIAGWKARFLSFVRRTVHIKSVMTAVSNHVMQGAALSIHLCDKLNKINKDFLWGSSMEKKKLHLVGWSKVIRQKEERGLGIQAARAKNITLLAKFNWRLYQEKDLLWAKVLLNKYCSHY